MKNLPQTLYETYDRVLEAAPTEDRLFVEYALQWIALHNELFNGKGIPCEVLIEATEEAVSDLTGKPVERSYDQETLREVCGCLIDIFPIRSIGRPAKPGYTYIAVQFAHYSVREYLNTKPSRATFGLRSTNGYDCKGRLLRTTLLAAQSARPHAVSDQQSGTLDLSTVTRELFSDFKVYSVLLALRSLIIFASQMCHEAGLIRLAADLVDPSSHHYSSLQLTARGIQRATALLENERENRTLFDSFWNIEWTSNPSPEFVQLYNLLTISLEEKSTISESKILVGDAFAGTTDPMPRAPFPSVSKGMLPMLELLLEGKDPEILT